MFSVYMSWTGLLLALVSFSHCSSFPFAENHRFSAHDGLVHSPVHNRQLKAARVESQIGKRDISQAFRRDHELHYVDGKYN